MSVDHDDDENVDAELPAKRKRGAPAKKTDLYCHFVDAGDETRVWPKWRAAV